MSTQKINTWFRKFAILPITFYEIDRENNTSIKKTVACGWYWERHGIPSQMRLPNPLVQRMTDESYRKMWTDTLCSCFDAKTPREEILEFADQSMDYRSLAIGEIQTTVRSLTREVESSDES